MFRNIQHAHRPSVTLTPTPLLRPTPAKLEKIHARVNSDIHRQSNDAEAGLGALAPAIAASGSAST
jgi:hypothetical protein